MLRRRRNQPRCEQRGLGPGKRVWRRARWAAHNHAAGHDRRKLADVNDGLHWQRTAALAKILIPPGTGIVGGQHADRAVALPHRSEEHTSELQSLMRNSYAV